MFFHFVFGETFKLNFCFSFLKLSFELSHFGKLAKYDKIILINDKVFQAFPVNLNRIFY